MPTKTKTPQRNPSGTIASRAAKRPTETTTAPSPRSLAETIRVAASLPASDQARAVAHGCSHMTDAELRDLARNARSETVRVVAAAVLAERLRGGVIGGGKLLAGEKPSKKADRALRKAVKHAAAVKDPDERAAAMQAAERLVVDRLLQPLPGYGAQPMPSAAWAYTD